MTSPSQSTIARSIVFSSSRTLPGHAYSRSSLRASGVDPADLRAEARVVAREEVVDEEVDVLLALAQRRDQDRQHVEAVEEVLAEAARLRLGGEVAVRRRDDADVDLDVLRVAEAADRLLLQHAQQLHLEVERQLADLVEEERAAVGLLEEPAAIGVASVNAPFLWPKSSLSRRFSGIAPQLTATKGSFFRFERVWIARATSSLPMPLSPWMSTVVL